MFHQPTKQNNLKNLSSKEVEVHATLSITKFNLISEMVSVSTVFVMKSPRLT